LQQEVNQYI